MAYLKLLPEEFSETADWAILLNDTRLPVHSHMLRLTSPVLAGLDSTSKQTCSEFAVEIPYPFPGELPSAEVFLRWLYRQEFEWTVPVARQLAKLGHLWNIAGEQYL